MQEAIVAEDISSLLKNKFETTSINNFSKAIETGLSDFDLIIADEADENLRMYTERPIISLVDNVKAQTKAIDSGVNLAFVKPFKTEELISTINKLL